MLNTTKTGLGRSVLKRWLLQPSTESEVLNDRYNAVECFARSENIHISENIQKIITVKNVPRLLKNLIAGHVPVQQWQALAQVGSRAISDQGAKLTCMEDLVPECMHFRTRSDW